MQKSYYGFETWKLNKLKSSIKPEHHSGSQADIHCKSLLFTAGASGRLT